MALRLWSDELMAGDVQLRENFPQGHRPLPEDGFTGDVQKDALSAIPPEMRQAFEELTRQIKEDPCQFDIDGQRMYEGLKNGSLKYRSHSEMRGTVELQDSTGKIHTFNSGHLSALVQRFGLDEVAGILRDKLPAESLRGVANGLGIMTLGSTSIIPIPEGGPLDKVLPRHPDISRCLVS
jgi:hypothetical protein